MKLGLLLERQIGGCTVATGVSTLISQLDTAFCPASSSLRVCFNGGNALGSKNVLQRLAVAFPCNLLDVGWVFSYKRSMSDLTS